jgi:DNA-binding CsgD family transcriptional regulator
MTAPNRRDPTRDAEILRLWTTGHTQTAIGKRYGLTQQRVQQIIERERRTIGDTDRQRIIEREIAFLDQIRRTAMDIADVTPAPATTPKGDLVVDPDDGRIVRDHSERLAALARAQATSQDLRRLLGLDQPVKAELSGGVRYEIVGVDPRDLT